jgi:hypothetical protein
MDRGQQLGRDVCTYVVELPAEPDDVPHYLPGENPLLDLFPDWYGLPRDGALGGAATIYPEYLDRMQRPEDIPLHCERYCECGENDGPCSE